MVFSALFLFLILGTITISSFTKIFSRLKQDNKYDKLTLWLFDPAGKKNLLYLATMFIVLVLSLLSELITFPLVFTTLILIGMLIASSVSLIAVNVSGNKILQYVNDLVIASEFIVLVVLYACQLDSLQSISAQIGMYFVLVIAILMLIQVIILTITSLGAGSLKNYIWQVYYQKKSAYAKPFFVKLLFTEDGLTKFDIEFKEVKKEIKKNKAEENKTDKTKEAKSDKNSDKTSDK